MSWAGALRNDQGNSGDGEPFPHLAAPAFGRLQVVWASTLLIALTPKVWHDREMSPNFPFIVDNAWGSSAR